MAVADVLRQIESWPAPSPGVAVVGPEGVIATHGIIDVASPWASVSKLLTCYAVLMAAQDEELGLDDPAGPEGSTIRHLLSHASGLPFEGKSPIARTGMRRIYSNTGFDLLGEVILGATGYAFNEYLRAQILQPLQMQTEIVGRPSAGLSGHVLDMTIFARELLAPSLLDESRLATAVTVAFPGLDGVIPGLGRYEPCDWGLGFELRDGKTPHWTGSKNSASTFGHFGGTGSFLWVDPVRRLAMCGLSGRPFEDENWAMEHWPGLFDAVLSELPHPSRLAPNSPG